MAQLSAGRSPLAMIVLTLLEEEPMHVYRMQQLIRMRDKESVVNVSSRNSLHQVLARLDRDGFVTAATEDSPKARVVYRITDPGREALMSWLSETLAAPRNEYPAFAAALACIPLIAPAAAARLLTDRIAALDALREEVRPEQVQEEYDLPRVFVIEDEYRRAMLTAEREWAAALVRDLTTGELDWARPPQNG